VIAGTFNIEKGEGGTFQIENFKNSKIFDTNYVNDCSRETQVEIL